MQDGVAQAGRVGDSDATGVRSWAVSLLLLIAVVTAFFDRIDIAILFTNRQFQADISVSDPALLGLLMTGFVLPYGASMFSLSGLSDVLGPRKTFSAIAGLLAVTTIQISGLPLNAITVDGAQDLTSVSGHTRGSLPAASDARKSNRPR